MTEEEIKTIVSNILPGGRIEPTALPQCKDISLFLLSADYQGSRLSREQGDRLMVEPMFWMFCWASGQAMARYIADNPRIVRGKRVLDFGCGSAVAAIAAAKAGAKKVWASDLDTLSIHAAKLNCRLNSVSVEVIQDWKSCKQDLDIILAADILYDSENMHLPGQFAARAHEALIADSRVKNFNVPIYRKIAQIESVTVPDLCEPAQFGSVNFYYASSVEE